jgi:hypothetical protein
VGIGSGEDAPIPVPAEAGEYLLRDETGALVSAGFDESSIRRVAEVTGGQYVRSYTGAELAPALERFLERARDVVGRETVVERVDFHPKLLVGAGVLMAVLLLI